MNKILRLMLLPAMVLPLVLASCDEDNDSNPTLDLSHVDEGFTLNTPAYAANNTYDLGNSETITLTCESPNYGGVPYAIRYYVQVALSEDFTTYTELSTSYTNASMSVDASELNKAVVALYQEAYPDTDLPETLAIYIRLRAVIDALNDLYDSGENPSETYSNVITLPSVKASADAAEDEGSSTETWYLVGGNIGDGSWGNSGVDDIGVSLYPLAYVSDGIISYTGYFEVGEFKLILTPGSWNDQWGYSDGYVKNDGGSGNISITTAGYYTVTLNYADDELSVEEYTDDVTDYSEIYVTGDFDSWAVATTMTLCTGSTHLWMYDFESDEDTTLKFTCDTSWSYDWGSDTFPSGMGVLWGSNIPVTAGSYILIFNDIDGGYTFVEK